MSLIVFLLGRLSLTSPNILALGFFAPEDAKAAFNDRYHLDEPLVTQYWLWLKDAVQGEFGNSYITNTPVFDSVRRGVVVTAQLTLGALALAIVLGGVIGIIGGLTRLRFVSRVIASATVLALAVPQFWLGLVLILLLGVNAGWLPAGGYIAFSEDPAEWFKHMLLPWVTLAIGPAGLIARVTQIRVVEEASLPHVLTAKSLGISRRRIVSRYIVRNALVEPTTVIGVQAGYMLGGAFLVEFVFNLPGLGQTALTAARQGDYPIVQAAAIYATVAFLIISLIVDVIHMLLDVRAEGREADA